MAKRKGRISEASQGKIIQIPKLKCPNCGAMLEPTEQSTIRIVEKGPKVASPHYVCDCSPYELQVFPNWHRLYGLGSYS